jgi:hypothetical protein
MSEPVEHAVHRIETARVRRSPRYAIFCVAGPPSASWPPHPHVRLRRHRRASPSTQVTYSTSQVFGFLCLVCIPIGLAVGAVVALLLDRSLARRTREVRIDHERVERTD